MIEQQRQTTAAMSKVIDLLNRAVLSDGMSLPEALRAAYRAGTDNERKTILEFLDINGCPDKWIEMLRAAMRPKPPSLAEEALVLLNDASDRLYAAHENTIRAALERLQELEKGNE